MRYVTNADEMRRMDALTSEHFGLPTIVLMEKAATAVAEAVVRAVPIPKGSRNRAPKVAVFAGGGNNGADAVAAGRLLMQKGYSVRFVILAETATASKLLKQQVGIAERYGAVMERFAEVLTAKETEFARDVEELDAVIDGLFGIGLTRKVEGQFADAVAYINGCGHAYKVSVDVPSGIHSDTGEVMGCAVHADETVTFNFAKAGHYFYPGKEHTGTLTIADAGIDVNGPDGMKITPSAFTFDESDLPLSARYGGGNKGTFGKVLVIAGSSDVAGAAILSAQGALHAGAGMVKVFTAAENRTAVLSAVPEAMMTIYGVLPDMAEEESFKKASASIKEKLLHDMQWSTALLIGPGIGTGRTAAFLLKTVLEEYDKPVVMDADALNLIADREDLRKLTAAYGNEINKWIIITPHLAEFARLIGRPVPECRTSYPTLAKELTASLHVTVLCKDAVSVVADEHEDRLYINTTGNSGMGTAGSGDVLSGICTALIAEKESAFYTASIAAFLHGLAGDHAAAEKGERYMTATDIVGGLKGILA